MRRLLPEILALPVLPLLIAQGKHTRRITPRLPEAEGARAGIAGSELMGQTLSIVTVGESPVAGVGVGRQCDAITGQLATALSLRLQRPVAWRACGKNGATVREAIEHLIPHIPAQQADVALVAFGVNDTTAFHSLRRWRNDMRNLLQRLDDRCAPRLVLLSGVPPVAHFPALPQPLRSVLGLKARVLDEAVREIAASMPFACYVPLSLDPKDRTLMAEDGYHPSLKGCSVWAEFLADAYMRATQPTPQHAATASY